MIHSTHPTGGILMTASKKNRPSTKKLVIGASLVALTLQPFSNCLAADFAGTLKAVTITDAEGANTPPTAAFTFAVEGNTVTFDASTSADPDGSITEYKWDFGDGNSGTGTTISHTFSSEDSFPVTLTIIDNNNGAAITQQEVSTVQHRVFIEQLVGGNDTGNMHTVRNYGQGFYPEQDTTVSSIIIKTGPNVYQNVPMAIRVGTSKDLSGSFLGQSNEVSVTASDTEYEFTFNDPIALSANTQYYFVVGATDDSSAHWADIITSTSDAYAPAACGDCKRYYEGNNKWSAAGNAYSDDLYFKIVQ